MSGNIQEITDKINRVWVVLRKSKSNIGESIEDSVPIKEFGIDSLAVVDFIVGLEKEFDTQLDDEFLDGVNRMTVKQIAEFLP